MNPLDLLTNLLFDYTIRTVALGAAVLGIVAGALGTFALLRRRRSRRTLRTQSVLASLYGLAAQHLSLIHI